MRSTITITPSSTAKPIHIPTDGPRCTGAAGATGAAENGARAWAGACGAASMPPEVAERESCAAVARRASARTRASVCAKRDGSVKRSCGSSDFARSICASASAGRPSRSSTWPYR
ncbi:hypothetical protein DM77_2941 [Burkholderia mallei]|nr:hypothetical protein DM53_4408 [Burkholderia mallei]KOT11192.1 hypothetical protein DM77_2941 [Burkholderia mallei]